MGLSVAAIRAAKGRDKHPLADNSLCHCNCPCGAKRGSGPAWGADCGQAHSRAAITTPNEAGTLLRAIEGFDGHATTRAALHLMPHVFVRPGVLRFADGGSRDRGAAGSCPPAKAYRMTVERCEENAQSLEGKDCCATCCARGRACCRMPQPNAEATCSTSQEARNATQTRHHPCRTQTDHNR